MSNQQQLYDQQQQQYNQYNQQQQQYNQQQQYQQYQQQQQYTQQQQLGQQQYQPQVYNQQQLNQQQQYDQAQQAPPPAGQNDGITPAEKEVAKKVPGLLEAMNEYEPTVPEPVIDYVLQKAGCNCTDPKLKRMIALATQKFIYETASNALSFHKIRQTTRDLTRDNKQPLILTMEDLSASLQERGVDVIKPAYFVDN